LATVKLGGDGEERGQKGCHEKKEQQPKIGGEKDAEPVPDITPSRRVNEGSLKGEASLKTGLVNGEGRGKGK